MGVRSARCWEVLEVSAWDAIFWKGDGGVTVGGRGEGYFIFLCTGGDESSCANVDDVVATGESDSGWLPCIFSEHSRTETENLT